MAFKLRLEHIVGITILTIGVGIYAGLPSDQRSFLTPEQAESYGYDGPRMVMYETAWCGSCRRYHAEFASGYRASRYHKVARLTFVDADNYSVQRKYNINAYPTFVLRDAAGRELERVVGYPGGNASLFRMVDRHGL